MSLLDGLNEQQYLAVTTTEGPVLVLAGPGSGKTRVLTHRIAYMLDAMRIPPYHILASTFTNKAAGEMSERITSMGYSTRGMLLGTFHSICARILRQEADYTPYERNFTIYDSADQRALVKSIMEGMDKTLPGLTAAEILSPISRAKNELITSEAFPVDDYRAEYFQFIYTRYMQELRKNNAMDFDDLLMQTVVLFQKYPDVLEKYQLHYRYLMVDEFQDTNIAQYEFVKLLGEAHKNVFVVGDPDQSIYAFRGADYRNLQRFMQDFPEYTVITLDENYRSHQLILDAAMAVIRHNPDYIKRDLFSLRKKGALIEVWQLHSDYHEGDYITEKIYGLRAEEGYSYRDIAVMYRTNMQSRVLENAFREASIPYQIVGGTRFYDRKEIKDMLAYLHVINNPNDTQRLLRIINLPPRSIGKKSQDILMRWIAKSGEKPWDILYKIRQGETGPLASRAAASIANFVEMLEMWMKVIAAEEITLPELLDSIINEIGYHDYIKDHAKTVSGAEEDWDNLNELRRELFDLQDLSLSEYLEQNALLTDIDRRNPEENAVTLMTLHSAKGLEFPVVFLAGVEDGLIPHVRSRDDNEQKAEERRLLYVGITRAKDRLYLSYVEERGEFQGSRPAFPSPFLSDLPPELIFHNLPHHLSSLRTAGNQNRYQKQPPPITRWSKAEPIAIKPRQLQFSAGDVVYHRTFGQGVVQNSSIGVEDEEVVVLFETSEKPKTIVADYLVKR